MTAEEVFGDWMRVIDKPQLINIVKWLKTVNTDNLCPAVNKIFKAFRLCSYKDCRVVMLGQDPYPQKGVATGILFGNSKDTPEERLSPSLKIVKEAAINYNIPHNNIIFDNTLETWATQGILMINTAFTCEVNNVGSHFIIWKPFVTELINNINKDSRGIIFVLFGTQAGEYRQYITYPNKVIETYHPAYYARRGEKMSPEIFTSINTMLKDSNNEQINFYKETDYGNS